MPIRRGRALRLTSAGAGATGGVDGAGRELTVAQALRTPQFAAIALAYFACCAAHSGPIFHMVTHATDQGIGAMTAASALGVSGLSSIAGRLGGGLLADRVGAKATLLAGLALQAVMIVLYLGVREVGPFYALAIVFGFGPPKMRSAMPVVRPSITPSTSAGGTRRR